MNSDDNWDWSSFWTETLNQIKDTITEQEWVMWLSNLEYISGTETTITISVPSSFYKDQVSQRYGNIIAETLENICGRTLSLEFSVSSKKTDSASEK